MQTDAVVDKDGWFDKRRLGLERWVGEGLVVGDGQDGVFGPVAVRPYDAAETSVQPRFRTPAPENG